MENINNYKDRFYNLMESTIGDVKPLLTENVNIEIRDNTKNEGENDLVENDIESGLPISDEA